MFLFKFYTDRLILIYIVETNFSISYVHSSCQLLYEAWFWGMHFGLLLLRQLVAATVRVRRVVWCLVPHGQARHAVDIGDIMRWNVDLICRLWWGGDNLRQPTLIRVTQCQTLCLAPIAEMNNGCLKNGIVEFFWFARCYFLLTLLSLTFRECVSDSDSPRPESLSIFALPRAPNRTSKFEQSEWDPAVFSEALFWKDEVSFLQFNANKYVMI